MGNRKFSVGDKVQYRNWIHPFIIIGLHSVTTSSSYEYRISGKTNIGDLVSGSCYEKDLTLIEPFSPSYDYIPTQEAEEDDI